MRKPTSIAAEVIHAVHDFLAVIGIVFVMLATLAYAWGYLG